MQECVDGNDGQAAPLINNPLPIMIDLIMMGSFLELARIPLGNIWKVIQLDRSLMPAVLPTGINGRETQVYPRKRFSHRITIVGYQL